MQRSIANAGSGDEMRRNSPQVDSERGSRGQPAPSAAEVPITQEKRNH